MKLTRTVSYALQAVARLGDTFGASPVPCSQLAAEGDMPGRFLLQILRKLVVHEILMPTRGVDGGYVLARPPEEITLLEIVEAIDGPIGSFLPMEEAFPKKTRIRLDGVVGDIQEAMRSRLSAVTVADLCKPS